MSKRRGKGEGSIYRRKDGRWAAEITIEGRDRKTLYGKTREEVHEKLLAAQNEKRQGSLRTGPRQTVKDYLNDWLEVHRVRLKISTYATYRRHLNNHIIPALGHIQLQKLTADQVQTFCSKMLKEGLSPGTVRLIYTILNAALRDAIRRKKLAINVCSAVTLPRATRHKIQPLDREQARRLLKAAKGSPIECLLTLALGTGMRLGEILSLRWGDINLEERMLQVCHTVDYIQGFGIVESEPKTDSSRRSIILPPFVVDALKRHYVHQLRERQRVGIAWKDQDLVFSNRYGRYFDRMRLHTLFKRVLKDAGLPHMRFHDLRHSAATILLSMGVPAKVVQEVLGHSKINTTLDIYGHVLSEMQRDAMDKMDDFFGEEL